MLTSIHPFGERAKGNRFQVTFAAHLLGALSGGAALGVVLAIPAILASRLDETLRAGLAAVVCAAAVLTGVVLARIGRAMPSIKRQVDEAWLDEFRGTVYGFGYGVQLGFGVVTIVPSVSFWAFAVVAVLQGSARTTLLLGAVFGVTRGLDLMHAVGVHDAFALRQVMRERDARSTVVERLALVGLFAGASALLLGAVVS